MEPASAGRAAGAPPPSLQDISPPISPGDLPVGLPRGRPTPRTRTHTWRVLESPRDPKEDFDFRKRSEISAPPGFWLKLGSESREIPGLGPPSRVSPTSLHLERTRMNAASRESGPLTPDTGHHRALLQARGGHSGGPASPRFVASLPTRRALRSPRFQRTHGSPARRRAAAARLDSAKMSDQAI